MNNETNANEIKAELLTKMNVLEAIKVKYESRVKEIKIQVEQVQEAMRHERDDALYRLSLAEKDRDEYLDRIKDASLLLYDWDGYYDPETGKGDTIRLAELVEQAYKILQGESWRAGDGKS